MVLSIEELKNQSVQKMHLGDLAQIPDLDSHTANLDPCNNQLYHLFIKLIEGNLNSLRTMCCVDNTFITSLLTSSCKTISHTLYKKTVEDLLLDILELKWEDPDKRRNIVPLYLADHYGVKQCVGPAVDKVHDGECFHYKLMSEMMALEYQMVFPHDLINDNPANCDLLEDHQTLLTELRWIYDQIAVSILPFLTLPVGPQVDVVNLGIAALEALIENMTHHIEVYRHRFPALPADATPTPLQCRMVYHIEVLTEIYDELNAVSAALTHDNQAGQARAGLARAATDNYFLTTREGNSPGEQRVDTPVGITRDVFVSAMERNYRTKCSTGGCGLPWSQQPDHCFPLTVHEIGVNVVSTSSSRFVIPLMTQQDHLKPIKKGRSPTCIQSLSDAPSTCDCSPKPIILYKKDNVTTTATHEKIKKIIWYLDTVLMGPQVGEDVNITVRSVDVNSGSAVATSTAQVRSYLENTLKCMEMLYSKYVEYFKGRVDSSDEFFPTKRR